jgi:hypothetical protein
VTGISILSRRFSTLRLLEVAPGADAGPEALLGHAGVLLEEGVAARPVWDGLSGVSPVGRRLLVSTADDFTAAELRALAAGLDGEAAPEGLPEASAARVAAVLEEARDLLREAGAPPPPGDGVEGPVP